MAPPKKKKGKYSTRSKEELQRRGIGAKPRFPEKKGDA